MSTKILREFLKFKMEKFNMQNVMKRRKRFCLLGACSNVQKTKKDDRVSSIWFIDKKAANDSGCNGVIFDSFVRQKCFCLKCRVLVVDSGWWDVVWRTYSAARFKKTFRVSRETFILYLIEYDTH